MTFKCHPCYKNEEPWFDWVLIAWILPNSHTNSNCMNDNSPDFLEIPLMEGNLNAANRRAMLIPAKIICIVRDHDKDMFAIIHSCHQHQHKMSVLTYRWEMEYDGVQEKTQKNTQYNENDNDTDMKPIFHKVGIDTIQKHCLIIPYHQTSIFVMEVIDQEHWALAFSAV